jgi:hypothetical protein
MNLLSKVLKNLASFHPLSRTSLVIQPYRSYSIGPNRHTAYTFLGLNLYLVSEHRSSISIRMRADKELLLHQAVAILAFLEKNDFKQPAMKLKKQLENDFEGKVPKVKDLDGEWKWESHYESSSEEETEASSSGEEEESESESESESEEEESDSDSDSEASFGEEDEEVEDIFRQSKGTKKNDVDKKEKVAKRDKEGSKEAKDDKKAKKKDSEKKTKDFKKKDKEEPKEGKDDKKAKKKEGEKKVKDTKNVDKVQPKDDKKSKDSKNVSKDELKEAKEAKKKDVDKKAEKGVTTPPTSPPKRVKPELRRQRHSVSDDDETDGVDESKKSPVRGHRKSFSCDVGAIVNDDKSSPKRASKKPELRHQSISFSEHNDVKYISPRKKTGKRELFYSKMDVEGFRIDVEKERMDAMLADANLALGVKF